MYARGVECELQRVNETVRANRDVDESERKMLSKTISSIAIVGKGWIHFDSISKRRNFCIYYNLWISIIENVFFFFFKLFTKVETLLINCYNYVTV